MNDVNDVKVGMKAGSAFAFVSDGNKGMRVLQIVSPCDDRVHFLRIQPATETEVGRDQGDDGPALTISKATDRNRAVDNSGNQLAVFGRRGARPSNRTEIEGFYL